MKRKPVVGETLWAVNINNAARNREQTANPVIVDSVAKKYFRVSGLFGTKEFYIASWYQKSECSSDYMLYETERDFIDIKEREQFSKKIRDIDFNKISLDKLRRINEIIGEKDE